MAKRAAWKDRARARQKKAIAESKNDAGRLWFSDGNKGYIQPWAPKKAGSVLISVVPFKVGIENHPEDVDKGDIWWRLPFGVHFGIGPDNSSVICPASIKRGHCPICEEYSNLAQNWDENEEVCRAIKRKKWSAMNIVDPDDESALLIFAMSNFNFMEALAEELDDSGNEEHELFFAPDSDGRLLKVRFKTASIGRGSTFLKADRIDFIKREPLDSELLAQSKDPGLLIEVKSAEELERMMGGGVSASPRRKPLEKSELGPAVDEGEELDDDDDVPF